MRLLRPSAFFAASLTALLFGAFTQTVGASAFTVSNTNDTGAGSLRQAITDANADNTATANAPHTISFNISGAGLHTIAPSSAALPAIARPTIVDGSTQPGSSCGTLVPQLPFAHGSNTPHTLNIQIDNSGFGSDNNTLALAAGADGSVIKGLILNGAEEASSAIWGHNLVVNGVADVTIECNYIGVNQAGTAMVPNVNFGISSNGATDAIVRNNLVVHSILFNNSNGVTISNNIQNIQEDGSAVIADAVQGMGCNVDCTNMTIRNNLGTNGSYHITGTPTGSGSHLIEGNFRGVDSTGMVGVGEDQPFGRSIDISSDPTTVRNNVLNTMGDGIYVSNSTEHTIAGNKIGVAVNGSAGTNLGNSGKGILLYAVTDTTVGGSVTADRNIISNNGVDGIRLEANSSGNSIAGNYIGVLADGITSAGNDETGIMLENGSSNTIGGSLAERNVIANNGSDGIQLATGTTDTIIESNIIYNNAVAGSAGVNLYQAPNTTIGSPGRGNIVYSNHGVGISISSAPGSKIQANIIGTDNIDGVVNNSLAKQAGIAIAGQVSNALVGGVHAGEGNTVVGNKGFGIMAATYTLATVPTSFSPSNVAILGNKIYETATDPLNVWGIDAGLGIELAEIIDNTGDYLPDTAAQGGVTANDAGDADTGVNEFMNFPVLSSVVQDGSSAAVKFNLDAAGSPESQYRVEFFANDATDPSNHGEGQVYLGALTVASGSGQQGSFTLPTGVNLAGKFISATTTALNTSTPSGFGSTSEFSENILATVKGSLANTGINQMAIVFIATATLPMAYLGFKFVHRHLKATSWRMPV